MPEGPSTDRKSISVEAGNGMVLNIFIFEVYLSTKENTLQVFQNHAYKRQFKILCNLASIKNVNIFNTIPEHKRK